eukprot:UN27477
MTTMVSFQKQEFVFSVFGTTNPNLSVFLGDQEIKRLNIEKPAIHIKRTNDDSIIIVDQEGDIHEIKESELVTKDPTLKAIPKVRYHHGIENEAPRPMSDIPMSVTNLLNNNNAPPSPIPEINVPVPVPQKSIPSRSARARVN